MAGLYHYSRECDRDSPNFMNRKDLIFKELTGTLEVTCRQIRREGVGASVKHTAAFLPEPEYTLWNLKVIGDHSPVTLQWAVTFYVGEAFCLR